MFGIYQKESHLLLLTCVGIGNHIISIFRLLFIVVISKISEKFVIVLEICRMAISCLLKLAVAMQLALSVKCKK